MKLIKTVKSTPKQSISIHRLSYGDYRVVKSSSKGYVTKDFDTLKEAEKYAHKIANLLR